MSQTTQSNAAAKIIPLAHPITTAVGAKVDSLTLRRATVKDLRRMKDFGQDPADQELGLIGRLTGILPEDLDLVDAADYQKVQQCFRELLGNS